MTTQQDGPAPRNGAEQDVHDNRTGKRGPEKPDESGNESIDESMAEADRANGEGGPNS